MRIWHTCLTPQTVHETFGIYQGYWMPLMDRCWESEDGYSVMSRLIRTEWGVVEHVTIHHMVNHDDIPWAVKQEIKNELFGEKRTAIEVFPTEKNLVDVCNVYHLWVLPKDFALPFGIHPSRDPKGVPVHRGSNCRPDDPDMQAWVLGEKRRELLGE